MKTKIVKQAVLALLVGIVALIGLGCKHTAHGVGEDVEKAGEAIQKKTR